MKSCDRDPNRNFQKPEILPNFPKILSVYFWGDNDYFWGDNVYLWGKNVYSRGFSKMVGFLEFIFVAVGGFGDSAGRGAL